MILNFSYDTSVTSAPVGFTAALDKAKSFFQATFLDPVTVNIAVGYGEVAGQSLVAGALGESETFLGNSSYSQIKTALTSDAKAATDLSVVASLPANDPTGGNYLLPTAEAKALGLYNGTGLDGAIGFDATSGIFDYDNSNGVSSGQYDFYGVIAHEVTEVMGRELLVGESIGSTPNCYDPMDLLHFSSPGVRSFTGTQAGYLSPDNGATNLVNLNTNPAGDFGDWAASAGADCMLAFAVSGAVLPVTANDIKVMDAIGWDVAPPVTMTVIESKGATTLATSANHFYLLDSTGAGPSLKYAGADFVAGELGNWAPIGAEKTGTGYEIAWKATGADQYSLWSTDSNGNYITNVVGTVAGAVSGSNPGLEASETLFQQDLNGDGIIGVPPPVMTVIEAKGATTLATSANHFYLLDSTGAGPSLKYAGADFVAGELGNWTPIGAEKTATGYEIAWKATGANQYSLWSTDSNGNYISNVVGTVAGAVSGSNAGLEASETLFQQDLNGDGVIGIPAGGVVALAQAMAGAGASAGHAVLTQSSSVPPPQPSDTWLTASQH
jgi:hypothetical protein